MEVKLNNIGTIPANGELGGIWIHPKNRGVAIKICDTDVNYMLINGKRGNSFDAVRDINFSHDGRSYAYVATQGQMDVLIVDGEKIAEYEHIELKTLKWSDKGHLAYVYRQDTEYFIVVNEQVSGPFNSIPGMNGFTSPIVFRPNSNDAAYRIRSDNGNSVLHINGAPVGEHTNIFPPVFCRDGSTYSFIAEDDDKKCVVWNDEKGEYYNNLGNLILSEDGTQFGYIAKLSFEEEHVVINNKKGQITQDIADLVYLSGLNKFAYVASNGYDEDHETRFIVDGVHGPIYNDAISNITVSPNGKHFGYIADHCEYQDDMPVKSKSLIILNHKLIGKHGNIVPTPNALAINNSGTKIAYLVYPETNDHSATAVAINDEVGPWFDGTYGASTPGSFEFNGTDQIEYFAVRDEVIFLVKQAI